MQSVRASHLAHLCYFHILQQSHFHLRRLSILLHRAQEPNRRHIATNPMSRCSSYHRIAADKTITQRARENSSGKSIIMVKISNYFRAIGRHLEAAGRYAAKIVKAVRRFTASSHTRFGRFIYWMRQTEITLNANSWQQR